jgi:hypothetical protein
MGANVNISKASENTGENIRTSAKESLENSTQNYYIQESRQSCSDCEI